MFWKHISNTIQGIWLNQELQIAAAAAAAVLTSAIDRAVPKALKATQGVAKASINKTKPSQKVYDDADLPAKDKRGNRRMPLSLEQQTDAAISQNFGEL